MLSGLTNLLPPERMRSFRRLYFLRLSIVAVLVLAGTVVIHGVLLLPSYLYLGEQVRGREALLASLSASLAGSEEKEVNARVTALTDDAAYLGSIATEPAASSVIRAVLQVSRPGIRLSGFTYSPPENGKEARLSVSGIATSREALRRYEQSLGNEPYVKSTDLPISAYAKESDISFSIALSGPLMP